MKKNQKGRRLAIFQPSRKEINSLGKNDKREGSQKVGLKKWNLEEFGNIAQKINSLLDSITTLDAIEESRPLFGNKKKLRVQARAKLEKICKWRKLVGNKNLGFCVCEGRG